MKLLLHIIRFILVLLPVTAYAAALTPLTVGGHKFEVELAQTPEQKHQGLMFRRELAQDKGMLFIFEKPQAVTMWMRNTYLPLDMLFIDAEHKVSHIAANTQPLSRALISSDGPVVAVLEVNAGTAQRLNIREGDGVTHERLP